mmetsp:Transcript_29849/g.5394  ORF Transcript_29849/g.5394 Transcript_29849/m.5394 type:complete len:92 (-) Transcript_29849:299-574(-)
MFAFCFINSYSSLFYIAFAKWYFQGCYNNDCMSELSLQLTYIYLVNFLFNIGEIGLPFFYTKYKILKEKRRLKNLYIDDYKLRSNMSFVEL